MAKKVRCHVSWKLVWDRRSWNNSSTCCLLGGAFPNIIAKQVSSPLNGCSLPWAWLHFLYREMLIDCRLHCLALWLNSRATVFSFSLVTQQFPSKLFQLVLFNFYFRVRKEDCLCNLVGYSNISSRKLRLRNYAKVKPWVHDSVSSFWSGGAQRGSGGTAPSYILAAKPPWGWSGGGLEPNLSESSLKNE